MRKLKWLAPALLVAPISGIFLAGAIAQESTPTAAGVIGTAIATENCNLEDPTAAPEGADSVYSIVSDQSEARYVAEEELASIGATTAIGRTNAFIGQIGLDADGNPLACSRFDVDLRTLTSDKSMRDNYIYSNTLESETYPLATFVLTSVEGADGGLQDGVETEITLIGNFTVHGVTNLVAWTGTVTRDGDSLTGTAELSFELADFGMEEPSVRSVVSIDDTLKLQVDIVAQNVA